MTCLREKNYVLDELCSGRSYSALDHEFNVNESTVHIVTRSEAPRSNGSVFAVTLERRTNAVTRLDCIHSSTHIHPHL